MVAQIAQRLGIPLLFCSIAALLLAACADDHPCARYPDNRFDLARLELSGATHPEIQQGTPCVTCHPYQTIHQENCTGYPTIDMAEVRTQVDDLGEQACGSCHGSPRVRR